MNTYRDPYTPTYSPTHSEQIFKSGADMGMYENDCETVMGVPGKEK